MKPLIIIFYLFYYSAVSSQSLSVKDNGWNTEILKGKPSSVEYKYYGQVDRFGSSTEELIHTKSITFNAAGFYLSIKDEVSPNLSEDLEPPFLHVIANPEYNNYNFLQEFTYSNNENCLTEMKFQRFGENSVTSCYRINYECNGNTILEKVSDVKCGGARYETRLNIYRRVRYFDGNGNVVKAEIQNEQGENNYILISQYNQNNKLLSEKKYDGTTGNFILSTTNTYNSKGQLYESVYQVGKDVNNPYTKREITKYDYDLKGFLIKSQTVSYSGNSLASYGSGIGYYHWYRNEYYQNGEIKKTTKYIHFNDDNRDVFQGIEEYKNYDRFGNWLEKIDYRDCYNQDICFSKYEKIVRVISYSKLMPNDVSNFISKNISNSKDGETINSSSSVTITTSTNIEEKSNQTLISPNEVEDEKIYSKVEVEASFPGGYNAWKSFLAKNLNMKIPIDNKAPEGNYTAIAKFIVDKEGNLSQIKAETRHGFGMEQELIRILKISGKWVPAQQNGKNVSSFHRQSIIFVVEEK